MYEFIDDGLKYDDLNEFQKNKANWLEEKENYSFNTKQSYWRNLKKVLVYETAKGKDLYDFDKQEIIKLVKYMPTKKFTAKTALYTTIVRYMDWACEKGLNYVGNPCDTIDSSELFTINELAFKESYQELQEFYDFILGLKECTDVDRAMLTLLRYGVNVDDVGIVKWEDIDRENKILNINSERGLFQLPIDNIFIMMIDKAKMCDTRIKKKTESTYIDYGYVVKSTEQLNWQHADGSIIYNRVGEISRVNKISRISVPELNQARKYDLLFSKLEKNRKVVVDDIDEVCVIFEGSVNYQKRMLLKRDFQLMSGTEIEGRKRQKRKADNFTVKEVVKNEELSATLEEVATSREED